MEDLPEDFKTLSALEVLQKLERSGKFDYTFVSNLLDILKSIHRVDMVNCVDEYRRKYSQPRRGNGSDPTSRGRWAHKRAHRRNNSTSSRISLQEVAEMMHEDTSPTDSLSSSCASVNSVKTTDFISLSYDATLQEQQQMRGKSSLSPSPVFFHRSGSGGSVRAMDNTLEGQSLPSTPLLSPCTPLSPTLPLTRSPHDKTSLTPQSSCPLHSNSAPIKYTTQLSVVSNLQEWSVERNKINKSIYNHQAKDVIRLSHSVTLDLSNLGLHCHAKFHFVLHPYGVDIDKGKNTTLEVMTHLPNHLSGHAMDSTRILLHASAYDPQAQETINSVTVEGSLNQLKMHVFGFLPHLALKESHSQGIVVRGQITAMLMH
ncbi:hypothetical protein EMCRGX_G026691 [Ephydatia muelleri]